MSEAPNYFTCTLGQAAQLDNQQAHKTVTAFIKAQARHHGDSPAVGFPVPQQDRKDEPWNYHLLTFGQIHRITLSISYKLRLQHAGIDSARTTVALLCPSTAEFLFTWLSIIWNGDAALLIAPQCPPAAIWSLCKQCGVKLLLYDDVYKDQALATQDLAIRDDGILGVATLPFEGPFDATTFSVPGSEFDYYNDTVESSNVAYLHHTSGTSSGIPKAIPQSHQAAVGVLPEFSSGRGSGASFTTTPLYHGGIADLFRAWTSNALIWLFPGKGVPITSSTILKSLDCASRAAKDQSNVPPVAFFSSVPYVLQILEAEPAGSAALQKMSMVGVGGAALPAEIGDRLVSKDVNLLSRFGSAECGFLLSSQRKFQSDRDWQYLRVPLDAKFLRFEPQSDENGLSELVVLSGWPHLAKRNRESGDYATSDLFAAHPTIPNAWRYHSRADSQLTLITGKKFDPAPLEAAIGTSELVDDVVVFGNGQAYPGALLFRSEKAKDMKDDELNQSLWPVVEKLNTESQDHARLAKEMLRPMPTLSEPLQKSSKGTLIRKTVEARFAAEIDGAYAAPSANGNAEIPDDDVLDHVRKIVIEVSHRNKTSLQDDTDLFAFGIDSLAGIQVRAKLTTLLPPAEKKLPLTIVEDCRTVAGLTQYILRLRHGELDSDPEENDHEYMRQIVEEYSRFNTNNNSNEENGTAEVDQQGEVIVLTGATGALGAHLLAQLSNLTTVSRIYCLVRGSDAHAARQRVNKALDQRRLERPNSKGGEKVVVLQANLADEKLGLDESTYRTVAQEATLVLHAAWSVNFRLRLQSFVKDSIVGVTNLINLALAGRRATKFAFCSSVASVLAYSGPELDIPEHVIDDPAAATEIGYSKSKWVAEQICARANETTDLRGRVSIFRIGQLGADSVHGIWNSSEAWPLMLSSVRATHCMPDLQGQVLGWLPVDVAATAMISALWPSQSAFSAEEVRILHLFDPNTSSTWQDLLKWMSEEEKFETVQPAVWVQRLEAIQEREETASHPALRLLEHWKRAYASGDAEAEEQGPRKRFSLERTAVAIPSLPRLKPVDQGYFQLLFKELTKEEGSVSREK